MPTKILRSPTDLDAADICAIYNEFDAPVTPIDCGQMCLPHNPTSKPFCCDICQAVPAVYRSEWVYLEKETDMWHPWRGNECVTGKDDRVQQEHIRADTPGTMILLACRGAEACQRNYRALSCRQFPFYPYISADYRFIGLAYEWIFEPTCWVISHLDSVTAEYREQAILFFEWLFTRFQDEFENYAALSRKMRQFFIGQRRRIPILHRDGGYTLLSPKSERMQRVDAEQLPRYGPYR